MALRTTLLAALFAATALAAPSDTTATSQVTKRFASGWCTFHLHEDRSFSKPIKDHKIEVTLYDANEEVIDHLPQEEILQYHDGVYPWMPQGFDTPLEFGVIDQKMDTPQSALEGFRFQYGNDRWESSQGERCKEGKEAVSFRSAIVPCALSLVGDANEVHCRIRGPRATGCGTRGTTTAVSPVK